MPNTREFSFLTEPHLTTWLQPYRGLIYVPPNRSAIGPLKPSAPPARDPLSQGFCCSRFLTVRPRQLPGATPGAGISAHKQSIICSPSSAPPGRWPRPHAQHPASLPVHPLGPPARPPYFCNNVFLICPTLPSPAWPNQLRLRASACTEVIRLPGTVCLPPCPCLFSASRVVFLLLGLTLPSHVVCLWVGAARRRARRSPRLACHREARLLLWGEWRRKAGRGIRADQFWPDLLKCFVLALRPPSWRGWGAVAAGGFSPPSLC